MMHQVRSASAVLFYSLGSVVLVLFLLHRHTTGTGYGTLLNILDLPLIFFAFLYGGTSLMTSTGSGRASSVVIGVVSFILLALFLLFAWFNFGLPFSEPLV